MLPRSLPLIIVVTFWLQIDAIPFHSQLNDEIDDSEEDSVEDYILSQHRRNHEESREDIDLLKPFQDTIKHLKGKNVYNSQSNINVNANIRSGSSKKTLHLPKPKLSAVEELEFDFDDDSDDEDFDYDYGLNLQGPAIRKHEKLPEAPPVQLGDSDDFEINSKEPETKEKCMNDPQKKNQHYTESFNLNTSSLGVEKEFKMSGKPKVLRTHSVHEGEDITICWIETTTIKEDKSLQPPQRLVFREFSISFENSATIPDEYLECPRMKGEINLDNEKTICNSSFTEVIDEDTKMSKTVNLTTFTQEGNIGVTKNKRIKCGMGSVVTKEISKWLNGTDSHRQRIEVKVSPSTFSIDDYCGPVEDCTDEEGVEKPTEAPKDSEINEILSTEFDNKHSSPKPPHSHPTTHRPLKRPENSSCTGPGCQESINKEFGSQSSCENGKECNKSSAEHNLPKNQHHEKNKSVMGNAAIPEGPHLNSSCPENDMKCLNESLGQVQMTGTSEGTLIKSGDDDHRHRESLLQGDSLTAKNPTKPTHISGSDAKSIDKLENPELSQNYKENQVIVGAHTTKSSKGHLESATDSSILASDATTTSEFVSANATNLNKTQKISANIREASNSSGKSKKLLEIDGHSMLKSHRGSDKAKATGNIPNSREKSVASSAELDEYIPCSSSKECSNSSELMESCENCRPSARKAGSPASKTNSSLISEDDSGSCDCSDETSGSQESESRLEKCDPALGPCPHDESSKTRISTTEPTTMTKEHLLSLNNISSTAETRRSTIPISILRNVGSHGGNKLALRIQVSLEHINEKKETHKLAEVEKNLTLNENLDEHGNNSLLLQIQALNNSANDLESIKEIFNCSILDNLYDYIIPLKDEQANSKNSSKHHHRNRRDLNNGAGTEKNSSANVEEIKGCLPGIQDDVKTGLNDMLSQLSKSLNSSEGSALKFDEKPSKNQTTSVDLKPKALKAVHRRKRNVDDERLVEEISRWSKERVTRSVDGGYLRSVTQLTILRDPENI